MVGPDLCVAAITQADLYLEKISIAHYIGESAPRHLVCLLLRSLDLLLHGADQAVPTARVYEGRLCHPDVPGTLRHRTVNRNAISRYNPQCCQQDEVLRGSDKYDFVGMLADEQAL